MFQVVHDLGVTHLCEFQLNLVYDLHNIDKI